MKLDLSAMAALQFGVASALTRHACPLLGQQYLPPTQLAEEPKFQAATRKIDATLNAAVEKAPYKDVSFSIGMFSASNEGLAYQYHHTSGAVANSTYGTKKVDADSIYRMGSISKLLTVYLWLIHEGDQGFNKPIGEILPQLKQYSEDSWNDVTSDWTDITVGDLAGQMGGLSRDYGVADLAPLAQGLIALPPSVRKAFPDLPENQVPTCGYLTPNYTFVRCTEDEYLKGVGNESPIFPAAYTPVYSNEGFALVGLALAKLTGKPVETLFNESYIKTLGLESTYYTVPEGISDHDVIPGAPLATGWSNEFGVFSPAGGFYSSTNDFAILGKAMLTSKLLPKGLTNRWFKPTSFVEDWAQGVGRPWEIFRIKVNGQSIDIYSKGGDWGDYHSWYALIPTYDFGISVFTAGDASADFVRADLPNVLVDAIAPVLDQIARDQSAKSFVGHYSSDSSNSSVTVTTNSHNTGLIVTQWISNGADLFALLSSAVPNIVFRIIPNQLPVGEGKIAFTGYYASSTPPPVNGTFFWNCPGWVDVDELTYGNIPLGQMVFTVGEDGVASGVEVRGLREMLKRQ